MIISVDPGYTTGIVILHNFRPQAKPVLIDFDVYAAFEIPWRDRILVLRSLIVSNRAVLRAVVCERFKLFPHADTIRTQIGSEMPSSRVIGVLETVTELNTRLTVQFQETWARKQVRVLPHHMASVKNSPHTFDAYCHGHYYARTHASELIQ